MLRLALLPVCLAQVPQALLRQEQRRPQSPDLEQLSQQISAALGPETSRPKASLLDSVLLVARSLGFSRSQVDRLSGVMASLDQRSYVHILQALQAALQAPQGGVADKVGAVVTAAARANYSASEVAAAAAAAVHSLADDAATTTLPLQGLAHAVGQLGHVGAEGQAAVVAAAGVEAPRSQLIIADMFQAVASTTPPVQWDGSPAVGSDARLVADAVQGEAERLAIPEEEKLALVHAALAAALRSERPELRLNGRKGLPAELASDLAALSASAFAAGFGEEEVALLKGKWQEMAPQHRAAAKRCLDALAGARPQRLPEGNASVRVAYAVKAFKDAGASARDVAHVAAKALRVHDLPEAPRKEKPTSLEETVLEAKVAGLSDEQASAMLKVMAGLGADDLAAVTSAWDALGGKIVSTTQVPPGAEQSFSVDDFGDLEELSVVAFATLKVGLPEWVEKADGLAREMGCEEQMAGAAAIMQLQEKQNVTWEDLEKALKGS